MATKHKEKRHTRWYVECRDAHTNKCVAEALLGLNSQEVFSLKECADGKERALCQVPDYAFVATMMKSKSSAHLDFVIYRTQTSLGTRDDSKPSRVDLKFAGGSKKTDLEKLEARGLIRRAGPPTKRATQF